MEKQSSCSSVSQEVIEKTEMTSDPEVANSNFLQWLEEQDLEEFGTMMKDAGYDDLELLQRLTEQDLKEFLMRDLKLSKPGHCMRVLVAVRQLRGTQGMHG